jgi:hypothetical protein
MVAEKNQKSSLVHTLINPSLINLIPTQELKIMNTVKYLTTLAKPVILGSIMAVSAVISTSAFSATPFGTQFTAEQRLKFSRLASKNRQNIELDSYMDLESKRDDAFDENNSGCGNVEIGNVERPRFGQRAQKIDVLIAGDVIVAPGASDC